MEIKQWQWGRDANLVITWSCNDTIQERSNSDFDVKCATIQF